MAIQNIKLGTIVNDGTGDNLRVGAQKINSNFHEVVSGSLEFESITFAPSGSGVWAEAKVEWDEVNKTIKMYTDEPDVAMQMGQEMWMRVYNDTTSSIADGKVVTVVGVSNSGVPHIDLAISSIELSAKNVVGFSTHTIEPGTFGYVTTRGFVKDVDTTAGAEGALIYLSATDAGEIVDVRPSSPNWEIKVGGIAKSGVTDGIFYVEMLVLGNLHSLTRFFNGTVLEPMHIDIHITGSEVTLEVHNDDLSADYISLIFKENFVKLPSPSYITLVNGTDRDPISNFVFVTEEAGEAVLEISQSGFPQNETFVPIAETLNQSPTSIASDGLYLMNGWTLPIASTQGTGQLSVINAFMRYQNSRWVNGNVLTTEAEDNPVSNIHIQYTNGLVNQAGQYQLVPGWDTGDTENPSKIYVINDPNTAYNPIQSINTSDLTVDSNGVNLSGYYNVVIWASISDKFSDCKLYMNLPNKSYNKISDALNDVDKSSNFILPETFRGTSYLLSEITLHEVGGSIEIVQNGISDLRGLVPATGAGGGTTGGSGITTFLELTDTFISYVGNGNKPLMINSAESEIVPNTIGVAPTSSTATGNAGEVIYTADYIYVCVFENTWKRTPLSTWI